MMTLPTSLYNEIWDYCRVNSITNIDEFIIKLVKQGFTVEKFGATPHVQERIVEVPVEKIVEVPVEKIVEVPIAMVDTEIGESLRQYQLAIESLQKQLSDALFNNAEINKVLAEEQKKNKRDIYGE